MSSDHFSKVRELFALALEQPASEREAFVRERASDPAIASEVLRLMGLDEQPQIHTLQGVQAMADAEAAPLAQGRRVGKFELFEVLGEGGMGQVYRARRVDGPEHWVALKLMRRGLFNAASETRFLAEQQFLARLNHPNIAHYIDSGSDADGHVYVAMELVQGQRLLDFAKAKDLNAKQRVSLFRQLLAAVSYAHRQLIIHRDLKQANVLVTTDGVVKLLDFGIAKLLQDQSQMTGTIERLYTPTCAAPEQIRGEPCDVTTDVYALGVLLYELIAGKSIFDTEGKTPGEFENLVLNVPPSDMKSRVHPELGCQDIPTDLERIVAKAIRKEPNRRYGSVEQFDADLERLLNNEPVSVSGNGFLYRTQKFLSRNKLASGLTALIAIAVLSGLVITLQQNREIRAERDRANLALDAMKQAFLGADPGGEAGGEVKAKDILNRSVDQLAPLLGTKDAQFADLAIVMLEVQLSMGLIKDAEKTHQLLASSLTQESSRLCILRGRLLVETTQLDAAMSKLDRCYPGSQEEVHLKQLAIGRILFKQNKDSAAAKLFGEILTDLPVTHPEWNYAVQQEAEALSLTKGVEQALATLEVRKKAAEASLPSDHVAFLRLKMARLRALDIGGKRDELIEEGPKVAAQVAQKFGTNSLLYSRANTLVANALNANGEFDRAIPYYTVAAEVSESILGENHYDTLRRRLSLIQTTARGSHTPEQMIPAFEKLIVDIDRPGSYGERTQVMLQYASWLGFRSDYLSSQRVVLSYFNDPNALPNAGNNISRDMEQWTAYNYLKLGCEITGRRIESTFDVCKGMPRFNLVCLESRRVLCTPTRLFDPNALSRHKNLIAEQE